jgi:hypothetical protein
MSCKLIVANISEGHAVSIFRDRRQRQQVPPRLWYWCTRSHGCKQQNTVIIIITTVTAFKLWGGCSPQNSSILMKEEAGSSGMLVTIYQIVQLRAHSFTWVVHWWRLQPQDVKLLASVSTWSNFHSCRDLFFMTKANYEFPLSQKSESPSRDIKTPLLHQITFLSRFKDREDNLFFAIRPRHGRIFYQKW